MNRMTLDFAASTVVRRLGDDEVHIFLRFGQWRAVVSAGGGVQRSFIYQHAASIAQATDLSQTTHTHPTNPNLPVVLDCNALSLAVRR